MPSTTPAFELRVLQEFRLKVADADGAVGRMIAAASGEGVSLPLLTSIDDPRDVAILRTTAAAGSEELSAAERTERDALASFVTSWEPRAWYRSRVSEKTRDAPHRYRMAVTERGTDRAEASLPPRPLETPDETAPLAAIAQLWIGEPVSSGAGLLVLVGDYHDGAFTPEDDPGWPIELSRRLGVRIYDSAAAKIVSGEGEPRPTRTH